MARTARLWLTVAILGGMPAAHAQAPAPQPAATPAPAATRPDITQGADPVQNQNLPAPLPESLTPESSWEPEFLKTLPRPPDQPRSLFQPAAPLGPPPPDLERPYFQVDPILDPPQWGKPGWFTDVQVGVVHPHVFFGQMRHGVAIPGRNPVLVSPGAARFDWTAAPRLEIGYRFPSGFGAFSFSDRFFSATGTGPFFGPAGSTTRTSHIGVNYSDWDYISRTFTPWDSPGASWDLTWRGGIRLAETWITNRVDQPFARAGATHGLFIAGDSNYTVGAGPHFGIQVQRTARPSGLSFIMRLDIADTFTRVHQLFDASSTTLTPAGLPARGVATQRFWQQVPILNYQVGLGWDPPQYPQIHFYTGYVYEYWWQVAFQSNTEVTKGNFDNQGVVFQVRMEW
jgi:hypothetical protein